MIRASLALVGIGILLLLLGLFLAVFAGWTVMPSYLAGWLLWSSIPVGALPIVMLLDLTGYGGTFVLTPVLRSTLLLIPIAVLLVIPMLLVPGSVFGWANGHGFSTPFGQAWMTHGGFIARSVVYFVIWLVLALLFAAPPAMVSRPGMAALGLFIYAITATLASVDWAMTVEPAWFSAEYGLLFIATQAAVAASATILLASAILEFEPEPAAAMLLVVSAIWLFMHMIQFLVIWSGDKPSDITWYLNRSNLGSRITVWIGFIGGFVVPLLVLLSPDWRRRRLTLPIMALLVLCVQALSILWLITPSSRHYFIVSGTDVLEMAGVGCLICGACLWTSRNSLDRTARPHYG